jgi:hypothetical protein
MNHTLARLFVLCTVLFSYVISSAMDVDAEITELKFERFKMLNKIEKTAGASSTMADRSLEKRAKAQLSVINTKIMLFEQFKSKL